MRRGVVELLYVSGCQRFLAFVVRIFRRRMWTSRRFDVRMAMLNGLEISIEINNSSIPNMNRSLGENPVMYQIFITHVYYLYISYRFISIQRFNTHWFQDWMTTRGHIGHGITPSGDSRVKGRYVNARRCGDHYRHNCTRGIGFLATIFGRQVVGKVLATREKAISKGKHVGTWGNEATGRKTRLRTNRMSRADKALLTLTTRKARIARILGYREKILREKSREIISHAGMSLARIVLHRIYVNSFVAPRASTSFIKTRYSTGDGGQGLNVDAVALAPLQNFCSRPTAKYTWIYSW